MPRQRGGFFSFEWMITPQVIKIIFPIGAVACIILGIIMFYVGLMGPYRQYGHWRLAGPLLAFFGPVAWRLSCEATIVIFRIYETLIDIRDRDSDASKNVRTIYLQHPADPAKVEALQQAADE